MAKSLSLFFSSPKFMASARIVTSTTLSSLFPLSRRKPLEKGIFSVFPFSTRYPLQYDMIIHRPVQSSLAPNRRRRSKPDTESSPKPDLPQETSSELNLDTWVDRKLDTDMDKAKRKYYNKRRKRMYGSDSDDNAKNEDGFVELKPEVVEFDRLHRREEELYFHDAFAYPWEQDKHYKMVYQLEKKYFPDQCLDKAFIELGQSNSGGNTKDKGKAKNKKTVGEKTGEIKEKSDDDKRLVSFEKEKGVDVSNSVNKPNRDVVEKKVEEFFKCLKKVPNKNSEVEDGEPYLVTGRGELPPKWDGPNGTVVLVNKPKGDATETIWLRMRYFFNICVVLVVYCVLFLVSFEYFCSACGIG